MTIADKNNTEETKREKEGRKTDGEGVLVDTVKDILIPVVVEEIQETVKFSFPIFETQDKVDVLEKGRILLIQGDHDKVKREGERRG